MSARKFASITSSLLARKGDAFPSALGHDAKDPSVWNATDTSAQYRPMLQEVAVPNAAAMPQQHDDLHFAPEHDPELAHGPSFSDHIVHAGEKRHRLSLPLTAQEHERLGIVAVKRGMTRHQLMRHALDDYFEKLAQEYRSACACISDGGCGNHCDRP